MKIPEQIRDPLIRKIHVVIVEETVQKRAERFKGRLRMELCARKDVPVEQTWDLSLIFPEEKLMWEELAETKRG